MTTARKLHPLTTAIAAGAGARVDGSRSNGWLRGMTSRSGPFGAILLNHRGVSQ